MQSEGKSAKQLFFLQLHVGKSANIARYSRHSAIQYDGARSDSVVILNTNLVYCLVFCDIDFICYTVATSKWGWCFTNYCILLSILKRLTIFFATSSVLVIVCTKFHPLGQNFLSGWLITLLPDHPCLLAATAQ
jgi:hypothetical protein